MRNEFMNIFILIFFLINGFVFSFPTNHPKSNNLSSDPTYYPLKENITFTYQSSFGETKSKFTYSGESIIAQNESDKFKYRQVLKLEPNGVYVTETYQKINVFLFINKEAKYTYNKPLLRLPIPLTPGESWTWEGVEYSDGDSNTVNVTGNIFDKEDVTVPAGKFQAIKVITKIESSSNTKNIITEWYAENIGLVKATVSIEGGGFMGMMRNILGYGTINFELKAIKKD